jgi:hypothetical protein
MWSKLISSILLARLARAARGSPTLNPATGLEVEIKLRLHVGDIASINLKVVLRATPAIRCQGDTANCVAAALVCLIIALAVIRKDERLALIAD